MNKSRSLAVLATIALLALVSACTPKQFKLQLHLKAGETYHITTHVQHHFVREFMGKKQDITQDMEVEYSWKVTDVDSNGNATVEATYNHLKISQTQSGQTTAYDSAKDKKPPNLFAGLNFIIGKHFTVVLSPDGGVKQISGLDEMFKQVEDEAGLQGKQRERFQQSLTQTFGAAVIQDQITTAFGPYTDKPLKEGSTWESDANLTSFFPVTVHSTYTVKSWDGDKATIGVQSTIASDPNQQYKLPMFTAQYDLKGYQQGEITFDLTSGLPSHSSVKQHMEGMIHLLDPSGSESIPLPVTVDTMMEMKAGK